jgi:beta-glucanase (GH16 family)
LRRRVTVAAVLAVLGSALPANSVTAGTVGLPVPPGFSASTLQFEDRFSGVHLDPRRWVPFIASRASEGRPWNADGQGGSGLSSPGSFSNQEYDLPSQIHVHGALVIEANRQPTSGAFGDGTRVYGWRSGVVSSYGRYEFTGGYVQVEAKVPERPGLWPAIWLLPGPDAHSDDGYEIDLFEGGYKVDHAVPAQSYAWHLHTPDAVVGGVTATGTNLSDAYHLYGLRWVPGRSLTWYLDGRQVGRIDRSEAHIPDQPMELIIDLGVAAPSTSSFHSVPDRSTPSSASLAVRAVRVYS